MPDSMVGDRLATIPGQTAVSQSGQPYKLRVLKEHQIMDGCCDKGDSVDFRIPLRGAHSKFLTPTVKNVFNKFSVRFFLRVVVKITPAPKAREESVPSDDEQEEPVALEEADDEEIDSNFIVLVLWR